MPVLSTPPIDDHILDYHFPETEETTLANGLKLVVLTRPELPRITFRLGFHLGDKYDGDLPGKADLLAALLKKGCRGYTADAFADAIDLMGGYLDSASNNDSFFVYGTFLSEFTEKSLAMMFEAVRFPAFEAGELDREKRRMIADLENEKSSPGYLGQLLLQQKLYPGHPYGAYKTAASLQAIEVAHLREMRDSFLCPQGATLVVCGDTDLAEIRDICLRYGGD
nr:insulinase family protein [Calditrichia bacterium]